MSSEDQLCGSVNKIAKNNELLSKGEFNNECLVDSVTSHRHHSSSF